MPQVTQVLTVGEVCGPADGDEIVLTEVARAAVRGILPREMTDDWPAPQRPEQQPLPTTEALARSQDGYDRESVEDAFAAFYRHISQLDATLRALEAIESFRLSAGELRADLRSIRAAGWTPYPRGYPSLPSELGRGFAVPEALPRLALEIAFLVAVAVVAAVGGFSATAIIVVMAVAVTLAVGFEALVSLGRRPVLGRRAAPAPITTAFVPAVPVVPAAPAPVEEPGGSTAEIEAPDADEPDLIRDLDPWERGFDGEKEDEAPVAR
ncbi:MAG: hypothetical protein ACYDA3_09840 [Gaiellaceae bacterium]